MELHHICCECYDSSVLTRARTFLQRVIYKHLETSRLHHQPCFGVDAAAQSVDLVTANMMKALELDLEGGFLASHHEFSLVDVDYLIFLSQTRNPHRYGNQLQQLVSGHVSYGGQTQLQLCQFARDCNLLLELGLVKDVVGANRLLRGLLSRASTTLLPREGSPQPYSELHLGSVQLERKDANSGRECRLELVKIKGLEIPPSDCHLIARGTGSIDPLFDTGAMFLMYLFRGERTSV